MTNKIEVKSNFLKTYLDDSAQIHFLGDNNEASLYINVENLSLFKNNVELSCWIEFEQTNYAPIIILYLKLNTSTQENLFEFVYDVKEESDIDELNDIIKSSEININVMEFNNDALYFGFKYKISPDKSFVEELKRLIFKAKEYSRTNVKEYNFDLAIDDFLDDKSIFNSSTNIISEFEITFPQKKLIDEQDSENKFFTYTSKTSGDFHDEGDTLQVKVYKRDEYEKLKNSKNTKEDISTGSATVKNENIESLKNKIKQMEVIIKSKNKEIEKLKTENVHLKEELEYQKLDTPKKGWKLF